MSIETTKFKKYLKRITKETFIIDGEVVKVDKNKYTVDVQVKYDENICILPNVKVPYLFGMNDEPGLKCLIGFSDGNMKNAYVLAFFSNSKNLIINIGALKIDIKDKVKITADVEITGNLKVTGNVEDLNGTMQEMRTTFNTHTHPVSVDSASHSGNSSPATTPMN
jgi:hypothetical protein